MKFLMQTINGKVKHDFSFTLLESIEFNNWLRKDNQMEVLFTDNALVPGCIPIGSVEFVSNYIRQIHGIITPKPINIPVELFDKYFTGRNVFNGTEKDIVTKKFVKSNDIIKSFTEITDKAPKGNYQISDIIDIQSEWRAFVHNGKLVGLNNYSGDFTMFPNINKIKVMIESYPSQPIAFTLDVGISNGDTVIIEVHEFFSCGLYGFSDHKLLPFMFSQWFYNYINNKKLNK